MQQDIQGRIIFDGTGVYDVVVRFGPNAATSGRNLSLSLGLSLSLSVLRLLVPLLLARLRLRQTCYVITVVAQCGKFSVSTRVAATLGSRPSQRARITRTVPHCLWYTTSEKFMNWVLKLFELSREADFWKF